MTQDRTGTGTAANFLDRLRDATNAHDLDALVDCFATDYRNMAPAHPARGFTGREQVRANWQRIFAFVPDVQAQVSGSVGDDRQLWSEWEMTGTRLDGTAHRMCGVIIFGLSDGRASWARFYLEPVDDAPGGVDDAVRDQVHARPTP